MSYAAKSDFLTAHLTVAQVANLAPGDHWEFTTFFRRGTRLNMATGVGQANGIFTIEPGLWKVTFGGDGSMAAAGSMTARLTDGAGVTVSTVDGQAVEATYPVGSPTQSSNGTTTGIISTTVTFAAQIKMTFIAGALILLNARNFITIEAMDRPGA